MLWDIRNLSSKLHVFEHHRQEITSARFNPNIQTLFSSFSSDRRVNIWDLTQINATQTPIERDDGPPELLFIHGGHTSKVTDFDWNPNEELVCASVSEDNIIQIWEMVF